MLDPLPDLPLSRHPNYVTPQGLAQLQSRLQTGQSALQMLKTRPDRLDKLPEAAAELDIRYLEARLRTAILIDPATQPLTEVAFGLAVTIRDQSGVETTYEITGEDEADATVRRISPTSPLARALIGARTGDTVTWVKPSGSVDLVVLQITKSKLIRRLSP